MPTINVVPDILDDPKNQALPKRVMGFLCCQICHRKVRTGFAATDGWQWSFGHGHCVPNGYWMKATDFEDFAELLDWAYHLAAKETLDFGSWIKVVEYVRPQWSSAVKEVADRYFASRYKSVY